MSARRRTYGAPASVAFSTKTPRQATSDETASGGTPCSAWRRTADERTSRTTPAAHRDAGNPSTPDNERSPERVDAIAVTHGHGDHVGDTVALTKSFKNVVVIAQVELKGWLGEQGASLDEQPGLNKGGSREVDGIRYTLVN